MAIGEIDIAAQVNAAVTRELARMTAELQASSYENIGQGGSRGHSVDWFDAADGGGGGGIDMTNIDFGYVVTDVTARTTNINPGVFRHSQQPFTVLGAAGLVVNTSPAYVYVEYIRGSTPTIKPVTYDLNETIPDTTAYRHLLYTFTISSSGGLEDPTIHHLGGIFIGAYWA